MNISNILTLLRIGVIPIIVICIYMKEPFFGWIAFFLFCLASITDYFDGYIARLRNEITNFGTFLDPIADKLLVAAVILILTSKGVIRDWDTIPALIILLREITVSGLREYLAGIKVSIPVSRIAKLKTFLQLSALAVLILSESTVDLILIIYLGKIFLWSSGILTLYTAYDYVKGSIKHF
jgi:cardiolipin synthase